MIVQNTVAAGPRLSDEQEAFLRFHAEGTPPHRWAWRARGRTGSMSSPAAPDDAEVLTAWKFTDGPWQRRCSISRAGLDGLRRYWAEGFTLNEAGREALRAPR
jgi:hypothetical protein